MRKEGQRRNRIISLLVKRNMKKSSIRNIILILAVSLVTIMMTVMFGAGISLVENTEKADLRMRGSTINGFLPRATDDELEKISALAEVSSIGVQQYIAKLNGVDGLTDKQNIVMTSYSPIEWRDHILPTLSKVEGEYPEAENEVMLSEWTLDKLEIDNPKIGMLITLNYTLTSGEIQQKEFVLSGYYKDYIYLAGTPSYSLNVMAANQYYLEQGSSQNAVGNIVVSVSFAKENHTLEGIEGTFFIDNSLNSDEAIDLLEKTVGRKDIVVSGLNKNLSRSISIIVMPILAVFLILICGYLLIYNIVNISVLHEMHMYGQLKTLGATTGQIRQMVSKQVNLIAVVGIPIGILLGTIFAQMAVPEFLEKITVGNAFGDAFSCEVIISPYVYIFSVLFSYITVLISCKKSARIAGKVSPIEALRYIEYTEKSKLYKTSGGGKLYRMAFRNVFRNKKRAIVTFISLFLGFLIYLIVSIATYGVDYDIKYKAEMPDNFRLTNLSFKSDDKRQIQNVFSDSILQKMKNIEGIKQISFDYVEDVFFVESEKVLESYLKEQAMYAEESEAEAAKHFAARAVGLKTDKLLEFNYETTMKERQIKELLDNGKGIFLPDNGESNYEKLIGKQIKVENRESGQMVSQYTIVGIVTGATKNYTKDFSDYGNVNYGVSTSFYTSETGIRRLTSQPIIQTLRIRSESKLDSSIQQQLVNIFAEIDSVSFESQLQVKGGVVGMIEVMQTAGKIFAGFLVFMGMINFINVIFTNIYSRQKELATLESIGMTHKQLKTVLSLEGLYYSLITMALIFTIGIVISYFALRLIQVGLIYFADFGVPVIQLGIVFGIMILTCISVPILLFNNISKESVIDRLRKGQD